MKYQGYTILRNIEGYSIYSQYARIGWAASVEEAKKIIDNLLILEFA